MYYRILSLMAVATLTLAGCNSQRWVYNSVKLGQPVEETRVPRSHTQHGGLYTKGSLDWLLVPLCYSHTQSRYLCSSGGRVTAKLYRQHDELLVLLWMVPNHVELYEVLLPPEAWHEPPQKLMDLQSRRLYSHFAVQAPVKTAETRAAVAQSPPATGPTLWPSPPAIGLALSPPPPASAPALPPPPVDIEHALVELDGVVKTSFPWDSNGNTLHYMRTTVPGYVGLMKLLAEAMPRWNAGPMSPVGMAWSGDTFLLGSESDLGWLLQHRPAWVGVTRVGHDWRHRHPDGTTFRVRTLGERHIRIEIHRRS